MINLKLQKENFKNHIATLTDCGNIKILDFKNPESNNYRIRFIFEEDYCRCHISGDLGSLIATNYNNMTYEGFKDFVHNTGYFEGKIDCCERHIYEYDYEAATKELRERFEDYDNELESDKIDDIIDDMMEDFSSEHGFGSKAYDICMSEYDPEAWEFLPSIGKEPTGILELYMLAFELATQQLKEREKAKEVSK